jgi:hypothetical protein
LIRARVPGSVVGGRSPSSSTSKSAFLLGLAQGGLFRVFVQFDVTAQRQPLVELAMMNEQHLAVVNDKDGDGEINFLVDMRHIWPASVAATRPKKSPKPRDLTRLFHPIEYLFNR